MKPYAGPYGTGIGNTSFLEKTYNADVLLSMTYHKNKSNSCMEIIKNSFGKPRKIYTKTDAIKILSRLISKHAFQDTSGLGLYEEMFFKELEKFIDQLLNKYSVREELYDYIRRQSNRNGFDPRRHEGDLFIP